MRRHALLSEQSRIRWITTGRISIYLVVSALILLGAELGLSLYDEITDPACKIDGVLTSPHPLKSGANRIVWEESFRTTGLRFLLVGRALREADVERLQRGVSGSLYVAPANAGGPQGGSPEWEYTVEVSVLPSVRVPSVESVTDLSRSASPIEIGVRYDLVCLLLPTPESRSVAEALHASEFPARYPLSITLILDSDVADQLALQVAYSKSPRSLLRRRTRIHAPAPPLSSVSRMEDNPQESESL